MDILGYMDILVGYLNQIDDMNNSWE